MLLKLRPTLLVCTPHCANEIIPPQPTRSTAKPSLRRERQWYCIRGDRPASPSTNTCTRLFPHCRRHLNHATNRHDKLTPHKTDATRNNHANILQLASFLQQYLLTQRPRYMQQVHVRHCGSNVWYNDSSVNQSSQYLVFLLSVFLVMSRNYPYSLWLYHYIPAATSVDLSIILQSVVLCVQDHVVHVVVTTLGTNHIWLLVSVKDT